MAGLIAEMLSISDLQYILIQQYINTVKKDCDMILHLEYHDTGNTLIEQSVTALIKYIIK